MPTAASVAKLANGTDSKAAANGDFRFSVTDSSELNDRVTNIVPATLHRPHHRRVPSAESATSGIVWSAVVEKFSEMAQEIAGRGSPAPQAPSANLRAPAAKRTLINRAISDSPNNANRDLHLVANVTRDSNIAPSSKQSGEVPQSVQTEYPRSTVTDTLPTAVSPLSLKGASAPDSSMGESLSSNMLSEGAISPNPESESAVVPTSIMKNSSSSGSYADNELPMSVTTGRAKVKRARTVRVQSHHANVEGDYADFLKKASGRPLTKDGPDSGSLRSGRSGRSGKSARSGKSGVENGMYR